MSVAATANTLYLHMAAYVWQRQMAIVDPLGEKIEYDDKNTKLPPQTTYVSSCSGVQCDYFRLQFLAASKIK